MIGGEREPQHGDERQAPPPAAPPGDSRPALASPKDALGRTVILPRRADDPGAWTERPGDRVRARTGHEHVARVGRIDPPEQRLAIGGRGPDEARVVASGAFDRAARGERRREPLAGERLHEAAVIAVEPDHRARLLARRADRRHRRAIGHTQRRLADRARGGDREPVRGERHGELEAIEHRIAEQHRPAIRGELRLCPRDRPTDHVGQAREHVVRLAERCVHDERFARADLGRIADATARGADRARVQRAALAEVHEQRRRAQAAPRRDELEAQRAEREALAHGHGEIAFALRSEERERERRADQLAMTRAREAIGGRHEADVTAAAGVAPDRCTGEVHAIAPRHRRDGSGSSGAAAHGSTCHRAPDHAILPHRSAITPWSSKAACLRAASSRGRGSWR